MLGNDIPVSREVGISGCPLKDDRGHTEEERGIYDVGMSGDPPDITTAEEDIIVVDVEHVFPSGCSSNQVPCSGMHDALWLARRARGVKQEQRIFRIH
jgi:hypothetical protein